ncbi:MAG: hypothetical protein B7Y86_06695 [Brevundimonas subvibrioides]|uniref:Uncharacterized protein n=1 Tax=Brevundimonas subvibrioides TaxID=74313 RepID=A0A258HK32_9CAUL|nr:MAG: hypothetical protein B7Y86_06695 [Brevundimonas subvibrioides]
MSCAPGTRDRSALEPPADGDDPSGAPSDGRKRDLRRLSETGDWFAFANAVIDVGHATLRLLEQAEEA